MNGNGFGIKLIASVMVIVATVVSGVVWQVSEISQLRLDTLKTLHSHDNRILANFNKLAVLPARDRWRGQDMQVWVIEAEDATGLDLPDPRKIIRERNETDW